MSCAEFISEGGIGRRDFDFRFEEGPGAVGMATGATIHTANGLRVRVSRREKSGGKGATARRELAVA